MVGDNALYHIAVTEPLSGQYWAPIVTMYGDVFERMEFVVVDNICVWFEKSERSIIICVLFYHVDFV